MLDDDNDPENLLEVMLRLIEVADFLEEEGASNPSAKIRGCVSTMKRYLVVTFRDPETPKP